MPNSIFDSDLSTFFAVSDFGTAATYNGSAVTGIFDDDDVEIQMGEGPTEIISQPTFTGQTTDFPGIADGDVMVIGGETFRIKNWMIEDVIITVFLTRGT